MNIPLPGLKPDGQGGYVLCQQCALIWGAVIAGLVLVCLLKRKL